MDAYICYGIYAVYISLMLMLSNFTRDALAQKREPINQLINKFVDLLPFDCNAIFSNVGKRNSHPIACEERLVVVPF